MTNATRYHPSELAYLLSYERVNSIIGWEASLLAPPKGGEDAFYKDAFARLTEAKRLVPGKQPGHYRFSQEAERISATLADPLIAIATNRKENGGVHIMTHHVKDEHIVELSLSRDGTFDIVEYQTLGGPAGASAAFAGAAREPVVSPHRMEAAEHILHDIMSMSKKGEDARAIAGLKAQGVDEAAAKSIVAAFQAPKASALINVFYCANNVAQDAEIYAVLTNESGESWVAFAPAAMDDAAVLEKTSIGALAARILVAISARMVLPV